MKCITVLNFEMGRVYQYRISAWGNSNDWNPDSESIEDFLESVGHNVNNCEWMVHSDSEVVSRKSQWKRYPLQNKYDTP